MPYQTDIIHAIIMHFYIILTTNIKSCLALPSYVELGKSYYQGQDSLLWIEKKSLKDQILLSEFLKCFNINW